MLTTYKQIGSYKSNPLPALIVIAVIFVLINYALTTLASALESRTRQRGRPTIPRAALGPVPVDVQPVEDALVLADEEVLQERYRAPERTDG